MISIMSIKAGDLFNWKSNTRQELYFTLNHEYDNCHVLIFDENQSLTLNVFRHARSPKYNYFENCAKINNF